MYRLALLVVVAAAVIAPSIVALAADNTASAADAATSWANTVERLGVPTVLLAASAWYIIHRERVHERTVNKHYQEVERLRSEASATINTFVGKLESAHDKHAEKVYGMYEKNRQMSEELQRSLASAAEQTRGLREDINRRVGRP